MAWVYTPCGRGLHTYMDPEKMNIREMPGESSQSGNREGSL